MIKDGPNAWPADVAYKRLIRELWRQRDYVPPRQIHAGLPFAAEARPDTGPLWSRGGWVLDVDGHGSVVLRHDSGKTVVLATLEGDSDG